VDENQEPEESEETLAHALHRLSEGEPPEERVEGKVEAAQIPFEELDERLRGSDKSE
jgi:hypothetical protein